MHPRVKGYCIVSGITCCINESELLNLYFIQTFDYHSPIQDDYCLCMKVYAMNEYAISESERVVGLSQRFCKTLMGAGPPKIPRAFLCSPEVKDLLTELESCDVSRLVWDSEKKAFWVNIYHGLVRYLLIKYQVRRSVLYHPSFFRHRAIRISGFSWSLDQIEHGILRQNRRAYLRLRRVFSDQDIRNTFTVKLFDPRIHFILDCGAASCPVALCYSADTIDKELEQAERSFLASNLEIDHVNKRVTASKIFKWYRHDFSGRYIAHHIRSTYKVHYKRYDWRRR